MPNSLAPYVSIELCVPGNRYGRRYETAKAVTKVAAYVLGAVEMEVRDILFDRSLAELCIEFGMHSTYKINAHILFFECNAQIRVTHALVLRVWREMNILNHPVLDPFQFRVSRALQGNSRFLPTS